ncbi:transposase [Guyparkeria halophila]|uniref:Transposase n=1 Tax=Guyparkeria halophila TaxID=47960 RepID=A0ABZ0YVW6_9GAMM|nr:transposase [Guyparkeria halophila]WQH15514.1 transposase [Guyparkeria halophila]
MSYSDLRRGRCSEPGREYLVTAVTRGRRPTFKDWQLARLLITTFRESEVADRADWLAWVVMPDHFHALLRLRQSSLADVMQRVRGVSARRINRQLGRHGPLWQPNYHDHALREDQARRDVAPYIVANPVRAGLVERIGDYPHWDAVWL